jgi:hypothetical protein
MRMLKTTVWLLCLALSAAVTPATAAAADEDPLLDEAYWIWWDRDTNEIAGRGDLYKLAEATFTKQIDLPGPVAGASLRVTAEGVYTLSVNGKQVGTDDNWQTLDSYDIKPLLVAGRNTIVVKAKSSSWYAGLFVAGRVKLTDGKEVTIVSDDTWDCSNAVDKTTAKAEKVVRGVNGGWWNNCNRVMVMPDAWYRLNADLVTPCIPWARPLAGGKVRALVIQPRTTQRDTVELLQRADIDATVVFSDIYEFPPPERAPFFPITRGMRRQDVVDDLRKALAAGPYGVVVLGQLDEGIFHDVLAGPLQEMVRGGVGLIYTNIPPRKVPQADGKKPLDDPAFEKDLTAAPIRPMPDLMTRGVPFEALPAFQLRPADKDKDFRKVADVFQYGKGRVVRLRLAGGWGLLANAPDRNDLHYEYYQSFAIKTLLWAAGREPAVRFVGFPAGRTADRAALGTEDLSFGLSGSGDCTVRLALRSPEKLFSLPAEPVARPGVAQGAGVLRPIHEAKLDVHLAAAAATTPVKFSLPPLPAGRYFLDVTVATAAGQVNWATAALDVTNPVRIAEVRTTPAYIDVAGGKAVELKAAADLSAAVPDGASVRFGLLDNYDRLLAVQEVKLPAGVKSAEAAFPVKGFATTLGKVRAELVVAGQATDIAVGRFTAVRRDWDRFCFVGWAGFPGDHSGNVYARVLAGLGFDACRGMAVSHDTLEAADTVALPGYAGLPRSAFDITPAETQRAKEATDKLRQQLPFDPLAYYCGDEIDYGGGEELSGRVVEFRKFLQERYGTLAALNRQWETNYASFDDVYPIARKKTLAEAEKGKLVLEADYFEQVKPTGNYSRWMDQWLSNYKVFGDMARRPRAVIKGFDSHARVGVDCPMWPFASCGHDWYTFLRDFEMFAPYGRGGEILPEEEARSFARPGTLLGLEYGGYLYLAFARREELTDTEWHHWRVWNGLLRGFTSTWWYQLTPGGNESNISPGLTPVPTLEQYARDLERIRGGFHTLLRGAKRQWGDVAVHYSVPSRLMCPVLPDMGYEQAFNAHFLVRIMAEVVGQPFTFVANEQIKAGGLAGRKVLIMPTSLAIGPAEAQELRKFVAAGGVLIADVRPGLADESGRVGQNRTMAELFGLTWRKELGRKMVQAPLRGVYKGVALEHPAQKFPADPAVVLNGAKAACTADGVPLVTCNDVGAGSAVCLNVPFNYYRGYPTPDHLYGYYGDWDHNRMVGGALAAILKAHGIAPPVRVDVPSGPWLAGLEASLHTDGAAQYVGLTKKRMTLHEAEADVVVHAPATGHVYDMLAGKYVTSEATWKVRLSAADVRLFSILPYRVTGLSVSLDSPSAAAGSTVQGQVQVQRSGGGEAVRHVIALAVLRPQGQAVRYLARNIETAAGKASFSLPLALNEPKGLYTLQFTDVATGATATEKLTVR